MRRLVIASAIASAFVTPTWVLAQTAPAPAPAPAPAEEPPIFSIYGFDLTGYVDVGYTNLNGRGAFNLTPGGPGVSIGGPNRVFDFRRNSLELHQVAFTLANQPKEGFGGLVNLTLGRDADVIASYKTGPSQGDGCNLATGQSATGSCHKTGYDFTQFRSEEHTSELQSRVDLVCRLLLEKKKKKTVDLDRIVIAFGNCLLLCRTIQTSSKLISS